MEKSKKKTINMFSSYPVKVRWPIEIMKWRSRMQRQIKSYTQRKHGKGIVGFACTGRWAKTAIIFAMFFALWGSIGWAQDSAQKDLKGFYQQNCVRCHGADGSAVSADGKKLKGQDFTDQDWLSKTGDDEMVKTILKGKFFGLAMPKFKNTLTEEEARWIVTNIVRKSKKGQVIEPEK